MSISGHENERKEYRHVEELDSRRRLGFDGMPTAQAMPIGDAGNGDAHVILVYGGCGPYGHRGPYGGCQPGGQWGFAGGQWGAGGIRPFYGPFGGAYCPPGYHLGPYRHACWPSV